MTVKCTHILVWQHYTSQWSILPLPTTMKIQKLKYTDVQSLQQQKPIFIILQVCDLKLCLCVWCDCVCQQHITHTPSCMRIRSIRLKVSAAGCSNKQHVAEATITITTTATITAAMRAITTTGISATSIREILWKWEHTKDRTAVFAYEKQGQDKNRQLQPTKKNITKILQK